MATRLTTGDSKHIYDYKLLSVFAQTQVMTVILILPAHSFKLISMASRPGQTDWHPFFQWTQLVAKFLKAGEGVLTRCMH